MTAANHLNGDERRQVGQAVERGVAAYVGSRRAKIPAFAERHFSFRGAFALHRKTLGRDAYKIPLNLLWSLPAFLAQTSAAGLEKLGAKRLGQALGKVPLGLQTEYQKEINWLDFGLFTPPPRVDPARLPVPGRTIPSGRRRFRS